jgi:hypothetical protein
VSANDVAARTHEASAIADSQAPDVPSSIEVEVTP